MHTALSPPQRTAFDRLYQRVVRQLPRAAREALDQLTICLDDHLDAALREELGLEPGHELLGVYLGTPLTEQSLDSVAGELPPRIHLFRAPLLDFCCDAQGQVDEHELARQIRITLLHELGHHYGFSEEDLDRRGYG